MAGAASKLLQQIRQVALAEDAAGITDTQLLARFLAQQDEAAFAALVRRHGPMVLGVCRRVLGNSHDAEDAFQVTFLVLVRKAAAIGRPDSLGNWLYGVAYRTALEARARTERRRLHEKQAATMPTPAEGEATGQENLGLLDRELSRLPDKYRVPVVLCELEGKSRKEAASLLRLPEGTLSSRLATARKLLATRLAGRGLVLTAPALTAALTAPPASAGVPPLLAQQTVQAAVSLAAGKAAATGALSAELTLLMQGVLRTMWLTQLKKVAALLLLTLGILGSGVGWLAHRVLADNQANGAARDPELKAVLDKAIKAAGGEDKLNRLNRITCKIKGVTVFPGQADKEHDISFTAHVQGFEHIRVDSLTAFARDNLVIAVFNPDYKNAEGWLDLPMDIQRGSTVIPGAGFGHDLYAIRLAQLLLPLRDKAFELSSLGEHKIGQRLTVGLKFGYQDRPSLDLYFDKETGLPVKAQIQVPVKVGGMEQLLPDEIFFDNYKEADGVKTFTKITLHRDGKKKFELEVTDIAPQEKFDAKLFAKP